MIRKRTHRLALALLMAATALTACSNKKNTTTVSDGVKLIYQGIQNRRAPAPEPVEVALPRVTARALQATGPNDPLATVTFPSVEITSVIRTVARNGEYSTWAAWGNSERRSLTTKGGMITATRSLGQDLMSADIDAVLDLVTRQEEGVVQYRQRYLDGNFQIVEAKSTCEISRGYDKEITVTGRSIPVFQMFSSCISGNQQFVDLYMVNGSGRIIQSRQWVGPELGFATLTQLR